MNRQASNYCNCIGFGDFAWSAILSGRRVFLTASAHWQFWPFWQAVAHLADPDRHCTLVSKTPTSSPNRQYSKFCHGDWYVQVLLSRFRVLLSSFRPSILIMAPEATKVVPLTCHGHSRPVPHLDFSTVVDDDQYYMISACKGELSHCFLEILESDHFVDNNPMLRDGISGDW
jgi:hypothetical protein